MKVCHVGSSPCPNPVGNVSPENEKRAGSSIPLVEVEVERAIFAPVFIMRLSQPCDELWIGVARSGRMSWCCTWFVDLCGRSLRVWTYVFPQYRSRRMASSTGIGGGAWLVIEPEAANLQLWNAARARSRSRRTICYNQFVSANREYRLWTGQLSYQVSLRRAVHILRFLQGGIRYF